MYCENLLWKEVLSSIGIVETSGAACYVSEYLPRRYGSHMISRDRMSKTAV